MPIAEILIEGEVGFDVTLSGVRQQFNAVPDATDIVVKINSIGGDVDEGFAIHDFLRSQGLPVTTIGEGRVYSIATIILLAGDNKLMAPNAQFMIHNPWAVAAGDADELRRYAAELERREAQIANFYQEKTGKDLAEIQNLMNQETFFTASETVEFGFADAVHEVMKVAAKKLEPVRAVAKFKVNNSNTDMSDQISVDRNVFQNLLSGIGAILNGKAVKAEAVETPAEPVAETVETVEESTPDYAAELAAMNERLTALEEEKAGLETELETANAAVSEKDGMLEAIQTKMKELESLPVAKEEKPEVVTEKVEPVASAFDGLAAFIVQNRKG